MSMGMSAGRVLSSPAQKSGLFYNQLNNYILILNSQKHLYNHLENAYHVSKITELIFPYPNYPSHLLPSTFL